MPLNKYHINMELDKVLALLGSHASCEGGRMLAAALEPSSDITEVTGLYAKLSEINSMSVRFSYPKIQGVKDVTGPLKRAEVGSVLSIPELLDIRDVLTTVRNVHDWRRQIEGDYPASADLFVDILPNRTLEDRLRRSIASETELDDEASAELSDIRRKIRQAQLKVRDHLENMIRSAAYQKYLQEPIVTMRDNRFVVPVKAEFRGQVRGMVHDTSSSGATVFVEPEQVVEQNNEIKILQFKEEAEIERIIAALSAEAGENCGAISAAYQAVVELDLYFAKSRLGSAISGMIPQISSDGAISLKKARHPLIDRNKVVPIDIEIGGAFDTLVITGPNTGGKTVAMKTLGLLTLMAKCGLMIPAADRSSVSIAGKVLSDIGDEQSIEQSLSTFSSHMKNIVSILKEADESTLVILDEIGAGTDPVEGAALAVSIIEALREKGCRVLATTHYAEIKMYALQTPGVENACCEFDVASLKPTYRLLLGFPGRSNAFAISERLGLDKAIVENAGRLVSSENIRFEDVVSQLERSRKELEDEKDRAEELRRQAEAANLEAQKIQSETEAAKEKEFAKAKQETAALVENIRAEAQRMLDEFEQAKKGQPGENPGEMAARARAAMKSGLRNIERMADPVREKSEHVHERAIKKGDTVRLVTADREGVVLSDADAKGYCTVQAGIIKTKVHISDLRLVEAQKVTFAGGGISKNITKAGERQAAMELDMRGMDIETGLAALEKFIDDSSLAGIKLVTVIHGKGTGVLRSAVQSYLRKNKAVKTFRLGAYGEGESGVTIVELA